MELSTYPSASLEPARTASGYPQPAKISTLLTLFRHAQYRPGSYFSDERLVKTSPTLPFTPPYRSARREKGKFGMDRPVTSRGTAVQIALAAAAAKVRRG